MQSEAKRASQKRRYDRRIKEAKEFLGGRCCNPECTTPYERLEFHHVEPESKKDTVTYLAKCSYERFWAEVKKCELMCEYCHDDFHADEIIEGERPWVIEPKKYGRKP